MFERADHLDWDEEDNTLDDLSFTDCDDEEHDRVPANGE
jgi:hypothetical protein